MSSQAAAPRLLRAVAETTQPYGPLLEGNAMHTLQVLSCAEEFSSHRHTQLSTAVAFSQEYLSDASQVDVVYLTVLARASGEPLRLLN